MIHFLNITIQNKGGDDFRAFLEWGSKADSETMCLYEIRGYGDTPSKAADDAYAKYMEDREYYSNYQGVWE
jgi:hypothetical protein